MVAHLRRGNARLEVRCSDELGGGHALLVKILTIDRCY
jgi:hypothetical protein